MVGTVGTVPGTLSYQYSYKTVGVPYCTYSSFFLSWLWTNPIDLLQLHGCEQFLHLYNAFSLGLSIHASKYFNISFCNMATYVYRTYIYNYLVMLYNILLAQDQRISYLLLYLPGKIKYGNLLDCYLPY